MTKEKLKRIVAASAVAGTLVVAILLAVILYQIVRICVLNGREKRLNEEIARQEEILAQNNLDLEYWETDWAKEQEAYKYYFVKPGDN